MITNANEFFDGTAIQPAFDITGPATVNGSPIIGYVSTVAEVRGLDLLISLEIVQTIAMIFMLYYLMRRSYAGRGEVK